MFLFGCPILSQNLVSTKTAGGLLSAWQLWRYTAFSWLSSDRVPRCSLCPTRVKCTSLIDAENPLKRAGFVEFGVSDSVHSCFWQTFQCWANSDVVFRSLGWLSEVVAWVTPEKTLFWNWSKAQLWRQTRTGSDQREKSSRCQDFPSAREHFSNGIFTWVGSLRTHWSNAALSKLRKVSPVRGPQCD